MYCKSTIKKLKAGLTSETFQKRPPQELKDFWLKATSSKIKAACLQPNQFDSLASLDSETVQYFGYCSVQVARFSSRSVSTFDIAMHTGIPPIIIAIYIEEYGQDWGFKLFEAKRLARENRGKFTILRILDMFTTAGLLIKVLHGTDLKPKDYMSLIEGGQTQEAQDCLLYPENRRLIGSIGKNVRIFIDAAQAAAQTGINSYLLKRQQLEVPTLEGSDYE